MGDGRGGSNDEERKVGDITTKNEGKPKQGGHAGVEKGSILFGFGSWRDRHCRRRPARNRNTEELGGVSTANPMKWPMETRLTTRGKRGLWHTST